jgi:hypothetical protein
VIFGERIILRDRDSGRIDEFGNEQVLYRGSLTVGNVLVAPASSQDLGPERPDGDATIMTFHFPKTYIGSLKGCLIGWSGSWWKVIGDPKPYSKESTPGVWNRPVQARLVKG